MSGFQIGCRVRVLRGRQFAEFKERDEGVILEINDECRNCVVVFDGRKEKVQVALKHLRVVANGRNPDSGASERSPKVLAKEIANEMRLADLSTVQVLEAEVQELRCELAKSQRRCEVLSAKAERCFESEACAKQEELQADLVAARAEATAQELQTAVASLKADFRQQQAEALASARDLRSELARQQQELAEERLAAASLRQELHRVSHEPGNEFSAKVFEVKGAQWAEQIAEQAQRELAFVRGEGRRPERGGMEAQLGEFESARAGPVPARPDNPHAWHGDGSVRSGVLGSAVACASSPAPAENLHAGHAQHDAGHRGSLFGGALGSTVMPGAPSPARPVAEGLHARPDAGHPGSPGGALGRALMPGATSPDRPAADNLQARPAAENLHAGLDGHARPDAGHPGSPGGALGSAVMPGATSPARPAADNLQAAHAQRDAGHLGSLGARPAADTLHAGLAGHARPDAGHPGSPGGALGSAVMSGASSLALAGYAGHAGHAGPPGGALGSSVAGASSEALHMPQPSLQPQAKPLSALQFMSEPRASPPRNTLTKYSSWPSPAQARSAATPEGRVLSPSSLHSSASDDRLDRLALASKMASKLKRASANAVERSRVTMPPRSLSGVEALHARMNKSRHANAGSAMVAKDTPEATLQEHDGHEGHPLRKRMGKRPPQPSPGRRADEIDDDPSWGGWF
ncbi:unnamed protein product [Effrenium voratum]|uniref:Uncharacterized protein n=1 Tax=Effrenium voratum TaxID=2562239 RepID=A0AA36IQZ7_9DINO|nr:unnamed protein product [Effrenium voratum]